MARRADRPHHATGLRVQASNGYTAFVTGLPKGVIGPTAGVGIKLITSGASATYLVPGTFGRRRIVAQFGDLGSLDVTFHPSGKLGRYHPQCTRSRYRVKKGVWEGSINFTGDGGYTTLAATQAKPTFLFDPQVCESITGGKADGGGWLSVAGQSTFFDAYQNDGRGTSTAFRAAEFESGTPMVISREVWTTGTPQAFTYDNALTNATAQPPPPFQGLATFQSTRRNGFGRDGTFTGSLSASFPGGPTVSLTDPGSSAHIEYANVKIGH
jgi:hypothetical protein